MAVKEKNLASDYRSSTLQDPDVIIFTPSRKRRRNQVVLHEIIEIDGGDDSADVAFIEEKEIMARSSAVPSRPISLKQEEVKEHPISQKLAHFKQFDTVSDYSDHYYVNSQASNGFLWGSGTMKPNKLSSAGVTSSLASSKPLPVPNLLNTNIHSVLMQPPLPSAAPYVVTPPPVHSKEWGKKLQQEWKILEKDLPDMIFVRVYEGRMDLLRAVIVGAAGTPYHDGLFFFDVSFPSDYPNQPPRVHYHSGGLRLNPNLYACGKVCLSLLNTWSGSKEQMWTPGKSTMLQVLLSIQALVLNAKPYFNEPGWAPTAGTPSGEKSSLDYNENTFLLSCKTMLYMLHKPPKHYEDFVSGHFFQRAHPILEACKAYMDGAQVGCLVGGGVQDVDEGDKSCSLDFKTSLGLLFPNLVTAFSNTGADCSKFLH